MLKATVYRFTSHPFVSLLPWQSFSVAFILYEALNFVNLVNGSTRTQVKRQMFEFAFYMFKISYNYIMQFHILIGGKNWILFYSAPTYPLVYALSFQWAQIMVQPWLNKWITVAKVSWAGNSKVCCFCCHYLAQEVLIFRHPPLSSSPQLRMNELTLGGIIDGNIWELCLQNTWGICVHQKRSEDPHSIMWQSNPAISGVLGRQVPVLSSF